MEDHGGRSSESYTPSLSTSTIVGPEAEHSRPLLLVKITGYRLFTVTVIVTFGTVKAIMSLNGGSVTATWLDWILGVVLGVVLYWLGLYESVQPPVAMWFFYRDFTRPLLYLSLGIVYASFGGFLLIIPMIFGPSIATLVIFVLSTIFVTFPLRIRLPLLGKQLPINLTTAPLISIAFLWITNCLGSTEIRRGIVGIDGVKPYNILIIFFSWAYMTITLDITGVFQAAAFWVNNRGSSNGLRLYLYFYMMFTALSVFLGNEVVVLSGTVFLSYYTWASELDPVPWLISEFAAANTGSMVLLVGNLTNIVICEGFSVNNLAFTAHTVLPFLGCSISCLIMLGFQFRTRRYIPRRLSPRGVLDPRSVLLDPPGALVGSVLLGACLIAIFVVSFLHVDVWKISLPFAVAKFIYDFGWDHYRYVLGILGIPRHGGKNMKASAQESSIGGDTVGDPQTTQVTPMPQVAVDEPPAALPTDLPAISNIATSPNPVLEPEDGSETSLYHRLVLHFPTFFVALPRLPFALMPFAFSQFILIEALAHQGWIEIFAGWLVRASNREMFPVIWLVGVLGVILCNISGTNIGATILLTKVVRAAALPDHSNCAGAISLAVASNIGAVSVTYSASLTGLLWSQILWQKGIVLRQQSFAYWNLLPLLAMTAVGLAIVCAEMAVWYHPMTNHFVKTVFLSFSWVTQTPLLVYQQLEYWMP